MVSSHPKLPRPIGRTQLDSRRHKLGYIVDRCQGHLGRAPSAVCLDYLCCCLGHIYQIVTRSLHVVAGTHVVILEPVRPKTFHKETARKNGVSHAMGAGVRPALEQIPGRLETAVKRVVGRSVGDITLEF